MVNRAVHFVSSDFKKAEIQTTYILVLNTLFLGKLKKKKSRFTYLYILSLNNIVSRSVKKNLGKVCPCIKKKKSR